MKIFLINLMMNLLKSLRKKKKVMINIKNNSLQLNHKKFQKKEQEVNNKLFMIRITKEKNIKKNYAKENKQN